MCRRNKTAVANLAHLNQSLNCSACSCTSKHYRPSAPTTPNFECWIKLPHIARLYCVRPRIPFFISLSISSSPSPPLPSTPNPLKLFKSSVMFCTPSFIDASTSQGEQLHSHLFRKWSSILKVERTTGRACEKDNVLHHEFKFLVWKFLRQCAMGTCLADTPLSRKKMLPGDMEFVQYLFSTSRTRKLRNTSNRYAFAFVRVAGAHISNIVIFSYLCRGSSAWKCACVRTCAKF